jgi:hypothetical protein
VDGGGSADAAGVRWTQLQPAVRKKPGAGGTVVHRFLRRLQSMSELAGLDVEEMARELEGLGAGAGPSAPPHCRVEGCTAGRGA